MIDKLLIKVKKHIPTYWPLQSFISTNPLHGLTDLRFDECLLEVSKFLPINGSLRIINYHKFYDEGKISTNNLINAVSEFLNDNKLSENFTHQLTKLLINKTFQHKIEHIFRHRDEPIAVLFSVHNGVKDKIREVVIKFLADFFDLGMAKWKMPVESNNLYSAWREYAIIENRTILKVINETPANYEDAIIYLFQKLKVPDKLYERYLIEIVYQLLGWSSFIHWLEERPDNPYIHKSANIGELIAIWLCYEYSFAIMQSSFYKEIVVETNYVQKEIICELISNMLPIEIDTQKFNMYSISLIWQRALELNYQENLITKIITKKSIEGNSTDPILAQTIFCVDTRSEGIRRKLESLGNYDTYGFAGFFGMGFKLHDSHSKADSLQSPGIFRPEKVIVNYPKPKKKIRQILSFLESAIHSAKNSYLSPFILFDSAGSWYGLSIFGKTIMPKSFNSLFKASIYEKYSYDSLNVFESKFTYEELAKQISGLLTAIGLTKGFAKYIIICGHFSQSENNPFKSSFDCGACGGNSGTPNSILFCQAANNAEIRNILRKVYLIDIPNESLFISSSHNTTTDEIKFYNFPDNQNENLFHHIQRDFKEATSLLKNERKQFLIGNDSVDDKKFNWAELVPELSQVNNAAFIIAPRSITRNLNLERRVFLQSYTPENDINGEILAALMTSVMMVGYFINSQYYFSSTDPVYFGSGNKTIHNVVGHFGVMEGNYSDFKIGLARQSVMVKGKLLFEPLRLLVVVYAKEKTVDEVLKKLPDIAKLFDGRWLHLKVIEPDMI